MKLAFSQSALHHSFVGPPLRAPAASRIQGYRSLVHSCIKFQIQNQYLFILQAIYSIPLTRFRYFYSMGNWPHFFHDFSIFQVMSTKYEGEYRVIFKNLSAFFSLNQALLKISVALFANLQYNFANQILGGEERDSTDLFGPAFNRSEQLSAQPPLP